MVWRRDVLYSVKKRRRTQKGACLREGKQQKTRITELEKERKVGNLEMCKFKGLQFGLESKVKKKPMEQKEPFYRLNV